MANIFLNPDEIFGPLGGEQSIFGNTGDETVLVAEGGDFTIDATTERVELPGNVADFTFQTVGVGVVVTDAVTGEVVATFNDLSITPQVVFGNGATTLTAPTVVGGSAQLGGTDIPTDAPAAVAPTEIDPEDTSSTSPISPTFDISTTSPVIEGDTATFTVELTDAPAGETFEVDYTIDFEGGANEADIGDITVDGIIIIDDSLMGPLQFNPGETSKTIEIEIAEDNETPEEGEGLSVTLSNATGSNATIGTDSALVDIEDVFPFTLSQETDEVQEGETISYTLTTLVPVEADTDVSFTVIPGDATAPDQGSEQTNLNDFEAGSFNPSVVTIPAGSNEAIFDLNTIDDGLTELPEEFSVEAEVAGETLSIDTTLLDGGTAGTTFTLTTGEDSGPAFTGTVADEL